MSGFGFSGDTYVSEADRVKSDLDNVFADFDAIARPKGAMAPLAPAPQNHMEWPNIEAEPDLSSFDDILTLTQNLDEELSAWEGIVSHDVSANMPQSAPALEVQAEPIVSQPYRPAAVDPWPQAQRPAGLNGLQYQPGRALEPEPVHQQAPLSAPAPAASAAVPPTPVQQAIFNAPVLFSSRQLGQTDLAATQQTVQQNLAGIVDQAILEIEPIQPISTLPAFVPRPALPVLPQMPQMAPAPVHEEPAAVVVESPASRFTAVVHPPRQQEVARDAVEETPVEPMSPPPTMPQLAPRPISPLHRAPPAAITTQEAAFQQPAPTPEPAEPVQPAAPVMRRFPNANTGLPAEGGQQQQTQPLPQQQQVRMQPNGIAPRQPGPMSPGQQQAPGAPGAGPVKRPVFRRAPTEGSLVVTPDTAQRVSDPVALSQPQTPAEPNRMSPGGRPMLSRSATDASSKPVASFSAGPKQPGGAGGVPAPNTGLARAPPRPMAGPPPSQEAAPSANISTELLRSPSSILASQQQQQQQQQQPPAGAPPKQAGGPPKRPVLKKAFSMREPAPQPLQQPTSPLGPRPVEAPAATIANRASPGVVMTAPMPMQSIQIPVGAFNQPRPAPLTQPQAQQPQQAPPMPRPAPQPQPPQQAPMQAAPEVQQQQAPLAAMPAQPLQPKQPSPRPQVQPMPTMPQVQSIQVQPMPQMHQPQPIHVQPMPQMPQPQPVLAQPTPQATQMPQPQHAHAIQIQPMPSMPQPQLAHVAPAAQPAPQQPAQPQPRPALQHHAHIQANQIPSTQTQDGSAQLDSPTQASVPSNQGFKQALQAKLEAQLQAQQQGIISPRGIPEAAASPPPAASSPEPAPAAEGLTVPQRPRDRTVSPTPPPTMNAQTRPPVPGLPPSSAAPPVPGAPTSLFPRPAEYPPAGEGPTRFHSVEELILDDKFGLMILIAESIQVTEATKTCAAAIKVFLKYDRVVDMISALIYNEVGQQTSSATLFRNNSIATHMMTSYTKVIGLPYLKMVIGPEILSLFENIDVKGIDYEIDPEKLGPKAKLDQNIQNLKGLVHKLFDRILNSRAVVPKPFLYICNALQSSTRDRFPEARYIVIAGFMFLRYLCPALVAPDGYKLVTGAIGENVRRVLVLLSKILQTIANEREFGDKESYMMCMNNLCVEYRSMLQYFFNSLAKSPDPAAPDNVPQVSLSPEEYEASIRYIYDQIKMNMPKLIAEVQKKDPATNVNSAMVLEALQNFDALPVMHPGPLDSRYTQKADQSTPPAHVVNARDNLMSQLNKYREMKEQMEKGRPAGPAGPAPAAPVAPQPQQPQFVANYRMPGQPVPPQAMSPPPTGAMPGQVPQAQPMPMMQPMGQPLGQPMGQPMPTMLQPMGQPMPPMMQPGMQLSQQPPSGY